MPKIFEGVVVSLKMQKTAVVEVARSKPHKLYKKLIKKDKRIKADTGDLSLAVGDKVRMRETRPISREKHFKIVEVLNK